MILRRYLKERDIQIGDFAERIGVSRQTLYLYLEGQRFPRPSILRRIHEETGGEITANDLLAATSLPTQPEAPEAVR